MNNFESRCLCLHRDLNDDMIERYETIGGTLWAVYIPCPAHGDRAMSPVWTAAYGPMQDETATDQVAVTLETLE